MQTLQFLFKGYCVAVNIVFWIGLLHAIRHRWDWWIQCRTEDDWKKYFRENVASQWIFYDGMGA